MKKFLLLILVAMTAFGVNAQTRKGEGSLMGSLGYQTNYERFGLQAQGRYVIANNLRIAPDLTFFFPKDKATGLDVNVNFHYVFNFSKDGQGFSVYPLAGIGMQNNFYVRRERRSQCRSFMIGWKYILRNIWMPEKSLPQPGHWLRRRFLSFARHRLMSADSSFF